MSPTPLPPCFHPVAGVGWKWSGFDGYYVDRTLGLIYKLFTRVASSTEDDAFPFVIETGSFNKKFDQKRETLANQQKLNTPELKSNTDYEYLKENCRAY